MAHKLSILSAVALASGLALSAPAAHATVFNFTQTGFYDPTDYTGGVISGNFDGTDGDSNGWITLTELASFNLSYSGDAVIPGFSHTLANLDYFAYKLGTSLIGDDEDAGLNLKEVIGSNWFGATGYSYSTGAGAGGVNMIQDNQTFDNVVTDEPARVPSPAVFWLLASALPGFFIFTHRKSS